MPPCEPQVVLPLFQVLRRSIGRMCAASRAPDGHGSRVLACSPASARVSWRAVQMVTLGVLWKLLTVAESNFPHMGRRGRPTCTRGGDGAGRARPYAAMWPAARGRPQNSELVHSKKSVLLCERCVNGE